MRAQLNGVHEVRSPEAGDTIFPTLFLAGGITNAPDWQSQFINDLESRGTKIVVFNPRRENYDTLDEQSKIDQITWEARHLELAEAVMFWFPAECKCRTTMLELGKFLVRPNRKIFVGAHPEFDMERDIRIQCHVSLQKVEVCRSLLGLAHDVQKWAEEIAKWRGL